MSDTEQFERRVGTTLRGKWTLDKLIGVGGMAAVYEATHKIGRKEAIKILHPAVARNKDLKQRFEREAQAVNRFQHPGVVEIRDIDATEEGIPFLVMEFLEGESLSDRARRMNGLPLDELLRIADELLDVLAAAHAQNIIHRDIKLDNLFLLQDGRLKVLDFGIARMRTDQAVVTRVGATLGTAAYMPPEQVRGTDVDHRVDIFAVGATMFRVVAKRRIHEAADESDLLVRMATEPAPPLMEVVPLAASELCLVVDRALAFDRDRRYPDAKTMQEDVRALREGRPPPFAVERDEAGDDPRATGFGAAAAAGRDKASSSALGSEPTGAALGTEPTMAPTTEPLAVPSPPSEAFGTEPTAAPVEPLTSGAVPDAARKAASPQAPLSKGSAATPGHGVRKPPPKTAAMPQAPEARRPASPRAPSSPRAKHSAASSKASVRAATPAMGTPLPSSAVPPPHSQPSPPLATPSPPAASEQPSQPSQRTPSASGRTVVLGGPSSVPAAAISSFPPPPHSQPPSSMAEMRPPSLPPLQPGDGERIVLPGGANARERMMLMVAVVAVLALAGVGVMLLLFAADDSEESQGAPATSEEDETDNDEEEEESDQDDEDNKSSKKKRKKTKSGKSSGKSDSGKSGTLRAPIVTPGAPAPTNATSKPTDPRDLIGTPVNPTRSAASANK